MPLHFNFIAYNLSLKTQHLIQEAFLGGSSRSILKSISEKFKLVVKRKTNTATINSYGCKDNQTQANINAFFTCLQAERSSISAAAQFS